MCVCVCVSHSNSMFCFGICNSSVRLEQTANEPKGSVYFCLLNSGITAHSITPRFVGCFLKARESGRWECWGAHVPTTSSSGSVRLPPPHPGCIFQSTVRGHFCFSLTSLSLLMLASNFWAEDPNHKSHPRVEQGPPECADS